MLNRTYKLNLLSLVYVLLISLLLQSCGPSSNQLIPRERVRKEIPSISTKIRRGLDLSLSFQTALLQQLPSEYELGTSVDDGDCFFDSLAQWLNETGRTNENTVKSLRMLCNEFHQDNIELVSAWHKADYTNVDKAPGYYMIQYTAEECKDLDGEDPIWGRPWIEGRILCKRLQLNGICVIEVLKAPDSGNPVIRYNLVNQETDKAPITEEKGQELIQAENIPILVNVQGELHFLPLWKVENKEEEDDKDEVSKKGDQEGSNQQEENKGKEKEKDNQVQSKTSTASVNLSSGYDSNNDGEIDSEGSESDKDKSTNPYYLINTIAVVRDVQKNLDNDDDSSGDDDSSNEEISNEYREKINAFDPDDTLNYPFHFCTITSKVGTLLNESEQIKEDRKYTTYIKEEGSYTIQPFLQKLAAQAFSEDTSNTDLARLKISFGLNRPRSLSTRKNTYLYNELMSSVDSIIGYKRFAFFWDYVWHEIGKGEVEYEKVRKFYKQLKKINKDKAEIFRATNEENTKHKVPYQALRERLKSHQNTKDLVKEFRKNMNTIPIYFSFIDDDVIDFNGIYSVYDDLYSDIYLKTEQAPIVMTTGYEFPTSAEELPEKFDTEIKAMVPALKFASELDRVVRVATASVIPLGVYYPEPNLCVLLPEKGETLPELFYFGDKKPITPWLKKKYITTKEIEEGNHESPILLRQVKDREDINITSVTQFVFSNRNPLITTIPTRVAKDNKEDYLKFNGAFKAGRYNEESNEKLIEDIQTARDIEQSHANRVGWAIGLYINRTFKGLVGQGSYGEFRFSTGYEKGNPLYCNTLGDIEKLVSSGKFIKVKPAFAFKEVTKELVILAIEEAHRAIAEFLKQKVFCPETFESSSSSQETEIQENNSNFQKNKTYSTDIKQESRKLAEAQGVIGRSEIPGWKLYNVNDKGNCFYEAIAHQLIKYEHPFLSEVPEGLPLHVMLRLHIQGESFKDKEWADDQQINKFVKKFPDIILAIIDTRALENGFTCYFYSIDDDQVITLSPHSKELSLPEHRTIVRLASTGNHFLSVIAHPQLKTGHITIEFILPDKKMDK